jgi:hypothetical protein
MDQPEFALHFHFDWLDQFAIHNSTLAEWTTVL